MPSGNTPPADASPADPDAGSDDAVPAATDPAPNAKVKKAAKSATTKHVAHAGAEPASVAPSEATPAEQDPDTNAAADVAPAAQATAAVQPLNGRIPVAQLREHGDNEKIYGKKEKDADLEKSVRKYGVLDPLLVTKDGRVISGHRRLRVATKLGIIEVPVRVFECDDELEIKTAVLEHNRHRVKNRTQLAAEAKMMQEIETELAARRKKGSAAKDEVEILPPTTKGKARDAVGKKLGISGKSVDKAVKVAGAIETLKADGKEAEAAEVEAALNKGYDTGYKAAVEKGLITATKPKKAKKEKASPKSKMEGTPPPADEDAPPVPPAPPEMPEMPAVKGLDSDTALERADEVLTFLRGLKEAGEELTESQRRDWASLIDQLDTCIADLGL